MNTQRPSPKRLISRRNLFTRGLGIGGGVGVASLLAACSGNGRPEKEINWANWTYYLDYDMETGTYPTLDEFMDETGIQVNYFEDIDDNDTFNGVIKDELELGQDIGFDTVVVSDWLIARWLEAGSIQKLNHANMPNVANMLDTWASPSFDPQREYSIPWLGFMTGIAVRKEFADQVRTLDDLLDPVFEGKVGMLSEMRDTMSLIMLDQGIDIESSDWGDTEFENGIEWLEKHLHDGKIATVKGGSYAQDLIQGNTIASLAWSGEIDIMNEEHGHQWEFIIPEAGGNTDITSFAVPNGTERVPEIEQLIDYYYDPYVAARVAGAVGYITPVEGAQEAMAEIDPELADNPLIFPDKDWQERLKVFRPLDASEEQRYTTQFTGVLGT